MNAPDNTIEQLARAIVARLPAPIPVDVALWSAADCAAYLRISEGIRFP
jgi:hypothetical protein